MHEKEGPAFEQKTPPAVIISRGDAYNEYLRLRCVYYRIMWYITIKMTVLLYLFNLEKYWFFISTTNYSTTINQLTFFFFFNHYWISFAIK